jgi:aspartate carbamoyltransferase catalytic subunit
LFRSREEKKLAYLAHIAGDGTFLRPCQRLLDVSAFQYPESAHVLLGLGVRLVGDEHLAVGRARSVFSLLTGEIPQANFLTPAAIISRLSAWISSITEPIPKYGETRCHIRDPDGYINVARVRLETHQILPADAEYQWL